MSIDAILSSQNKDGGWSYRFRGGRSWTEPTVYAMLALWASGKTTPLEKGLEWIRSVQQPDGGWSPQKGVDQSTWVTALAAMLPLELLGAAAHRQAVSWLLKTSGNESGFSYRLRQWLLGNQRPADQEYPGWPWVPGAAAWVGPTSLAILALARENLRDDSPAARQRVASGRQFLLARMCGEGGWNHGSSRAAGYESRPYPETTGMALAALRGVAHPKVDRALGIAGEFLKSCRSADALNWLRLGLLAHSRLPDPFVPPLVTCRTLPEASLALLLASGTPGRDLFGV